MGYEYTSSAPTWANRYLWPILEKTVRRPGAIPVSSADSSRPRAFDLGCGNGATSALLYRIGFDVVGVDLSESGIRQARETTRQCRFEVGSVYDDLSAKYGRFDLVVSLEVIEHCFYPGKLARTAFELLSSGGIAFISTPYHGYLKNVALALSGRMDSHFMALRDGGHIKFFSEATLNRLLKDAGFRDVRFLRAGRVPPLAKSMVAVAKREDE